MQLLTPGGRMALVLPDGIYGNDQLGYLRKYISDNSRILAIIDVPKETFMPHTSTKTTIILVQKNKKDEVVADNYKIFMAVCDTCGHDRRGNICGSDDIALVAEKYNEWREKNGVKY